MESCEVIVVGLGVMGSSTCYHLARRGVRVVGLEQFQMGHDRGSSHGFSRIYRQAYYEHPDYVPLLKRALDLWRQLETDAQDHVLHLTGGLYMGRPKDEVVAGSLAAARLHDLSHQMLDRAMLAQRYPQFTLPDDFVGLFEPNAGYVLPQRAVIAQWKAASKFGADLHENEPVLEWNADDAGVIVKTGKQEYRATHLVFCGGAWNGKLLKDLHLPLRVTRQVTFSRRPTDKKIFDADHFPIWAITAEGGGIYYGFPSTPGNPGVTAAHHYPGRETDPDAVQRELLPGDEESIRRGLEKYLPSANGEALDVKYCLYTNSPDEHFILDRHPDHSRVHFAAGFSGHGFKFGSVIGELMADLATSGSSANPTEFLRLSRLQKSGRKSENSR